MPARQHCSRLSTSFLNTPAALAGPCCWMVPGACGAGICMPACVMCKHRVCWLTEHAAPNPAPGLVACAPRCLAPAPGQWVCLMLVVHLPSRLLPPFTHDACSAPAITPAGVTCLLQWCHQGVLLLNAALTVRAKQSNSHAGEPVSEPQGALHCERIEKSNLVTCVRL